MKRLAALLALCLLAPLAARAVEGLPGGFSVPRRVTAVADADGDTRIVSLRGDRLEFLQDQDLVLGEGSVAVRQGATELYADHVRIDMRERWIVAEGNVAWKEGEQVVHARRVRFNLKTRLGSAEGILYSQGPWVASGESVEKTSDKDVELRMGAFTTCDRRSPHYRLTARSIKLVIGEWIAAYHVVVYAGVVPVFYFPYFSRNLRDPRPPLIIMPGYDETNGVTVRNTYNYWLSEGQYGSVQLDWMEKQGVGEGLTHYYAMNGGKGEVGGYYHKSKDGSRERWNSLVRHEQDLGGGYGVDGRLEVLSDRDFNKDLKQNAVDNYQRDSHINLQSNQERYSWNVKATDTWNRSPYWGRDFVASRTLPEANFRLYDRPVAEGWRLYRGMAASVTRKYTEVNPDTYLNAGVTVPAGTWEDAAHLAPSLSYSRGLPWRNTFSTTLSPEAGWALTEGGADWGAATLGYGTLLGLETRWNRWTTTKATHDYKRQLAHPETLIWSGATRNMAGLRLEMTNQADLRGSAEANYDLLPYRADSDLLRLAPLRFEMRYDPASAGTASSTAGLTALYHCYTSTVRQVVGSLTRRDKADQWRWTVGLNWLNNQVTDTRQVDTDAPTALRFADPATRQMDVLCLDFSTGFTLTPKWRVTVDERLDLAQKRLTEQGITLWRDLHCWEMQLGVRRRSDSVIEYGAGINLRAFPGVKASMPTSTFGW